jgi:hypothetical protein
MVRVLRILTYVVWAGTLFSWYELQSLRMEYTRTRPQSAREDTGQVHRTSGFYNKTVFLREDEAGQLARAYCYAFGLLGLGILGIGSVALLERRNRRRHSAV